MPVRKIRESKTPVVSPRGSRDTRVVGAFRFLSAIAILGAVAMIGTVFDEGPSARRLTLAAMCAVVGGGLGFAEHAYGGRAARAEERRIRSEILTRQYAAAADPGADREAYPPGRVIQMMTDGAERVTEFRQVYLGATLAAMCIPAVVLLYIGVFIDPIVGFVVLALVPVIPLAIGGFMRAFRKTSANSRRQRATLTVRYLDAIRNLVTIRLLGAGERVTAELRAEGEKNRGAIMRLLAGNQIVIIIMDGVFSLILICVTGGLTVTRAEYLTAGQALTIALAMVLLLEPLQQVAGFFYIGMGGLASSKEIRGYLTHTRELDTVGAVIHGPMAADTYEQTTGFTRGGGAAIELRSVTFDYGRGAVLAELDLTVPRGGRIAIMGPSGAGKTTLLGLLRGSLPPQEGRLRIDGHDLSALRPEQVRALTATVSQSTWMFTGTIADNLRLAREGATEEEMWHALRLAHVAEEVERMPRGLHTDLGEGAALVSGGQAQRISLARALLSGRRILLLDEPTSQVDIESETHIIDALGSLPRDWTLLMVTHRPSLLRIADTTLALTDGTLAPMEPAHV